MITWLRRRAQRKHRAALQEQRKFDRELERMVLGWDEAPKTAYNGLPDPVATPVAPHGKQKQEARFSQAYEAAQQRGYVDDGSSDLLTPLLVDQALYASKKDTESS